MWRDVYLSESTRDKIIEATLQLAHEKGYKGATTKKIANLAGVNEVTIFRHFGNKKGIVEAIIEKYGYFDVLEETFANKITWDIEKDLKMLVREYFQLVEKKRTVIVLSIKEAGTFPELDALMNRIPEKYTTLLASYFEKMIEKGKMKRVNPIAAATNFIFMNFGYFMLQTRMQTEQVYPLDTFIERNVELFIQSLR